MANIVMTDICNLRCPYCFANEFVNHDANEISLLNFKEATDFILSCGPGRVGLIGGEPLLHSRFKECMEYLLNNDKVQNIMIYTNLVKADDFINELAADKVNILVNCNSMQDMGEKSFNQMCANLDTLIKERHMKKRITLGINMYKEDFEYEYLLKLLVKYQYDRVRVSVTVPNLSEERNSDPIENFKKIKPRMKEFFHALMRQGILPKFDCNKYPSCLWDDEDRAEFKKYFQDKPDEIYAQMCNVECKPVIDILPDLRAVRCLGLSDCTKQNIRDFRNIDELGHYYINQFDSFKYQTAGSSKCADCYQRKTMHCTGGCLEYKIASIMKLASVAEEMLPKE